MWTSFHVEVNSLDIGKEFPLFFSFLFLKNYDQNSMIIN
jgi:hypothetical protein